jgi:glycosyltransferase involved in cell wall biosynthesis
VRASIIIPTRRRARLLAETLDSLDRQTEADFEVIVVCDGEDDRTRALAESYSSNFHLRWIITDTNYGQASARNTGARAASGELILFLDDDTSPAPDWLFHHRKHHRSLDEPKGVVVLGRLHHVYNRPPVSHTERFLRQAFAAHEATLETWLLQAGRDARDCVWIGLNTSIRKPALLASGGFDPMLRYVQEDTALGTRMFDAGAKFIYEPSAIVYHRSTKNLVDDYARMPFFAGRSDVYCIRDKQQRPTAISILPVMYHGRIFRRVLHRAAWERPDVVRGLAELCRAVTDATGLRFWFRVWAALALAAGYWDGVKAEGITLDTLRALVDSKAMAGCRRRGG